MKARLRAIAISSAALLWAGATISAQGQSFSVLHTFARGNFKDINTFTNADGVNPVGGLIWSGGRLYGVANIGGTNGTGTIFALNADGTGFTVLHQFDALDTASQTNTEGAFPSAGLLLAGGTIYGTANKGGIYGQGTVFSLNTNGTGFVNFYNFAAGSDDGAYPAGGLLLVGPRLYGTTYYGGNPDNGVVFALNTNGSGGISILKSFPPADPNTGANNDGAHPSAGLIWSGTKLYGTTLSGGANGYGVAFAINTNVSGTGFSVLHDFDANSQYPAAGLVISGLTLYGMSGHVVFALNTDGTGFAVLRQFSDVVGATYSGASPGLSLFGNTLYAAVDGNNSLKYGQVFSMNTDGTGFTDYHDFSPTASIYNTNADGAFPNGGLPLINGAVYGTTAGGGLNANGVVFKAASPLLSLACAPNKTVECSSAWSFDAPTASDTCVGVVVTIVSTTTNTAGHCGNTFDATRTWQATDACSNTAQCSQTVTVVDTTPPSITCVPNKTVECGSAWTFDPPTASDTCGGAVVTIVSTTTNTAGHCGNTFDATRTWQAADACSHTAQCSQTVTVVDTTPPSITCAPNKTVQCGSAWTFDPPVAADGCSGIAVTVSVLGTVTNGTCPALITRTWAAVDACGNSNTCSQVVTLSTLPTLTLKFDPPQWLPSVGLRLTISGTVTGDVTIQWTQDITNAPQPNWATLAHLSNFNGAAQYIDSEATNFVRRFYRAVAP